MNTHHCDTKRNYQTEHHQHAQLIILPDCSVLLVEVRYQLWAHHLAAQSSSLARQASRAN